MKIRTDRESTDLIRLLAAAVLAMHGVQHARVILPYPAAAQLALDRITALSLVHGKDAPASLPALLALCREPLSTWPIADLFSDVDPDAVFVNALTGLPTRLSIDWVSASDSTLGELADSCPSAAVYEQCREFLIDHPVVNQDSMMAVFARPGGQATWKRVQHLYGPVPDAYVRAGRCLRCPSCGCLAITDVNEINHCESEKCPSFTEPSSEPADRLRALPARMRCVLPATGMIERQLRSACRQAGAEVVLVPDEIDHLRVRWPRGGAWLIAVSVSTAPALLGLHMQRWSPGEASRIFATVPADLVDQRANFRAVFDRHRGTSRTELVSAEDLLHTIEGGGRRA